MLGRFEMILTGTESNVSRDGKTEYLYANLLQGSEVKRVRVVEKIEFDKISAVPNLSILDAEIDISEGMYDGKHYCNYKLVSFRVVRELLQEQKKG